MNSPIELPDFMQAGWEADLGAHTFSAKEIIEFAKEFDPQIFHLDQEAAKQSLLGGLCASGWHTAAMWMRKQRDFMFERINQLKQQNQPVPAFGPSPGFENLKWLKPVYAGDTINYFSKTITSRASKSRPDTYLLNAENYAINQHGQKVFSFQSTVFLKFPA